MHYKSLRQKLQKIMILKTLEATLNTLFSFRFVKMKCVILSFFNHHKTSKTKQINILNP